MKSTDGSHYIALDHLRGFAALLVFAWHFTHGKQGFPIPFGHPPSIGLAPLAILDEGHTGVALFMTLSGFLFAKLLDGKEIRYSAFFWNRALRLLPLLLVVIGIRTWQVRADGQSGLLYLLALAGGVVQPVLPNGGWSITAECHFYLLLPLLLFLLRKSVWLPLALIAVALAVRTTVFLRVDEVQSLAYWTIGGRIDQFVLGILAFHWRHLIQRRHVTAIMVFAAFAIFYWSFDRMGGFYGTFHSPIWIVMPTMEGCAFAVLIAWYESSFTFSNRGFSGFLGLIGTYSFSIYLLHFFWVFDIPVFIDREIMSLSNFYVAYLWAVLAFLAMLPIGYVSFRFLESPFLRLRKRYVIASKHSTAGIPIGNIEPGKAT